MNEILKKIADIGIVPVIALDNKEDAYDLAKALYEGGLPIAEVTFRTACACDVIKEMSKAYPKMLIGAGTVLSIQQVEKAINAGAKFIVSPGLNPTVVKYCLEKDILIIPGCANASDIELGLSLGIENIKFFPAEPLGGIKMIKALSAPYGNVRFMPTGGINEKNLNDYLNEPSVLACGGSFMIDKKAIENKDYKKIKNLCQEAVKKMLGLYIKHVGLNDEESNGYQIASEFAQLFCGEVRQTEKSYFGSELVEIMNEGFHKGKHGHIGIGTNNVDRARRYFESLGYHFEESTAKYDEKGSCIFIYFKEQIGGFALHLIK